MKKVLLITMILINANCAYLVGGGLVLGGGALALNQRSESSKSTSSVQYDKEKIITLNETHIYKATPKDSENMVVSFKSLKGAQLELPNNSVIKETNQQLSVVIYDKYQKKLTSLLIENKPIDLKEFKKNKDIESEYFLIKNTFSQKKDGVNGFTYSYWGKGNSSGYNDKLYSFIGKSSLLTCSSVPDEQLSHALVAKNFCQNLFQSH